MKTHRFRLFLRLAVLLLVKLGLSVIVTPAFGQSSTHSLQQTFTSANGSPIGTPVGIIDYNLKWTFNGSSWVSTPFNNTPGNNTLFVFGYINVGSTTYLYGRTQGNALFYTIDGGSNWTLIYSGGWPVAGNPNEMTCVNDNGTLRWFVSSGTYIYEIVGGTYVQKAYISSNSICSNMVDTIYVAMGTLNDRAYHIDNWATYVDMGAGLSSIDWKNDRLISVSASGVKTRSTNPADSWETLITLTASDYWQYCSWLTDQSANTWDLAIGSNVTHNIQVWREIVAPTAEFSGSPTSGIAPLTVQFSDLSSANPTEWAWDFGDGGTSTEQNPSHIYEVAGSFPVSLTASNSAGSDIETKENFIVVSWLPMDASFSASPEVGVAPLTVSFTDQSAGNPTSWAWNFGDGGTSTLQNPSHIYTNPGSYTVALTVTGPGGSDTETQQNLILVQHPAPVANFVAVPTSGTAPLAVQFTDQSTGTISTWAWNFGDGGTSVSSNPTHTYTVAGVYDVTLTVTGPGGTDIETKLDYITVVEVIQVVITSFTGDPAGFISRQPWEGNFTQQNASSAQVTSAPGNSYSVNFGAGTITSTALTITGNDVLTLTAYGASGSDTETLTVPVFADHNLLADTIGSGNMQIFTTPNQVSPDFIEYEMHLPLQDFYNLYNFSFQAVNTGSGIQSITFATAGNTLIADVVCNTTSNYQTFAIAQKESGLPWFQTGMIILLPNTETLEMLSEDISGFVNPGEAITTKIFTGAPTNWTFTNETYNQVVYTDSHTQTGITQKTVIAGNWTLGPILQQIIRIDVSIPTKTVSRYFMMDGTTGVASPDDDKTVIVSPNPSNNRVNISGIVRGTILTVTDLQGKVLMEKIADSENAEFYLTDYQSGVYFIKITTMDKTEIRKIIIR